MKSQSVNEDTLWDPAVGLWWRSGAGHTRHVAGLERVHVGSEAAGRLFSAGMIGELQQVPANDVLRALRCMQADEPGPLQGCLKWYWEEPAPRDTNAAFFTALSLIPLRKFHAADLDETGRDLLNELLCGLQVWFHHAVGERSFHYPNKFLGDLVCAWLIQELLGMQDPGGVTERTMLEAATYWQNNGWGWGEHMSDGYVCVCLIELSLLLLLAERLPEPVRKAYAGLMTELLAIEDLYGDGPRVPALRSYAFLNGPQRQPFRDRIASAAANVPSDYMAALCKLFHRLDWDRIAPARRQPATDVSIPCFDGARAEARIEADCRLGSVSRFPVMKSAEATTWGLSWQCFPLAFWHTAGDWLFLQWQTREAGECHSHPTEDKAGAYLGNALSRSVLPPLVGRTYCLQDGGNLLALRIMSPVAMTWERLSDRFRLVDGTAQVVAGESSECWASLNLKYPDRNVSMHFVDLSGTGLPELCTARENIRDWEVALDADALQQRRVYVGLWAVSLNGESAEPPQITVNTELALCARSGPEEQVRDIRWTWPDRDWHVRVDPLAAEPLVLLEPRLQG